MNSKLRQIIKQKNYLKDPEKFVIKNLLTPDIKKNTYISGNL